MPVLAGNKYCAIRILRMKIQGLQWNGFSVQSYKPSSQTYHNNNLVGISSATTHSNQYKILCLHIGRSPAHPAPLRQSNLLKSESRTKVLYRDSNHLCVSANISTHNRARKHPKMGQFSTHQLKHMSNPPAPCALDTASRLDMPFNLRIIYLCFWAPSTYFCIAPDSNG